MAFEPLHPPLAVQLVAPDDAHVKVVDSGEVPVSGFATKDVIVGSAGPTVTTGLTVVELPVAFVQYKLNV